MRGDSYKYPPHRLTFLSRNEENYPLIIIKCPSYLFSSITILFFKHRYSTIKKVASHSEMRETWICNGLENKICVTIYLYDVFYVTNRVSLLYQGNKGTKA